MHSQLANRRVTEGASLSVSLTTLLLRVEISNIYARVATRKILGLVRISPGG